MAYKNESTKQPTFTFDIYWSPEGRKIITVTAINERAAIRKAPMPYRKYLGEMYAVKISSVEVSK